MQPLPVLVKIFGGVVLFSLFLGYGFALSYKVCTNGGLPSESHTLRYELFSSKNASLEKENLAHLHLIPTDDHTWSNLIPRKMLREGDELSWEFLYRKIKNSNVAKGAGDGFLKEISLHDVRLEANSIHGVAQQTNLEYLLMLEVDRLVWSFRKTAGLETPADPYGGWEAPDVELRGHFVGIF